MEPTQARRRAVATCGESVAGPGVLHVSCLQEGLKLLPRRADRCQEPLTLWIWPGLLDQRQGALRLSEIDEDISPEPVGAERRGPTTGSAMTHHLRLIGTLMLRSSSLN